jgi:flavin-dependent dehydrogenase
MTARTPDLLVIGGGPAGLATAIRARQAGLSVTLLDGGSPPIDKACGEGLMPDGAALLQTLGVVIPPDRCRPFRGIRYLEDDLVVEGPFPGPPGIGVRRTDLHAALVRRAVAVGVDLRWGVRVEGLHGDPRGPHGAGVIAARGPGGGRAESGPGPLRARFVVAADGLHSPLRRAAGLEGRPARARRFGLRRHFAIAPWTDHVEVHWGDGVEAYVTPLGADLVGVALLFAEQAPDFDRQLRRFPALAARIAGAAQASRQRGAGPLEQRVRGVVRGNLALVGDAAGYLDAITGEGLSLALHDAFAVVAAMVRGDLAAYAAAHRRIVRVPAALTRLVLFIERRPRVRRRVMRALAADPRLLRALLSVHVRVRPPAPVAAWVLPRLAWRLARPLRPLPPSFE